MGDGRNEEENARQRRAIASNLKAVLPELEFLELRLTRMYVQRVLPTVGGWTARDVAEHMRIVDERMKDELAMFSLIYLSPGEREYYQVSDLFGPAFKEAFPAANAEVTEAGTCFALGRYTASVFHLVRATEIGIGVVEAALGIGGTDTAPRAWGEVLRDLDDAIVENDRALITDPEWVEGAAFFRRAHGLLSEVRSKLRGESLHVETAFGQSDSEQVMSAVRAFLSHLACRLRE